MLIILIGAALVTCGVLLLFLEALGRRPLSDPHRSATGTGPTLEPRGQGLRFLGVTRNWFGVALIGAGTAMLLIFA
jgi:hypothetical protein